MHRVAAFVAVFCLMNAAPIAAQLTPPNYVVILCDDLGYGDLGCFGHPHIRTPHLDQLAAQGVRLTDCYSASPLCSPSRCGLLTGRTPSRCGIYTWIAADNPMQLLPEETTIAEVLRSELGYETCHVGKWHLNGHFNDPQHAQPGDHGFDYWFSTQNNAGPSHLNPHNFVRNGDEVGQLEGYSCQLVADEAIRWLTEVHDPARPFFLFVCFHEPHEPIASPPELAATYPEAITPEQADYFANVTNMDIAVGRLMAQLDEQDLTDNTLVWFTSDNGPEGHLRYQNAERSYGSPGPLRGMKLHLYDGGIRVPGIIRFPGRIQPGIVSSQPVCNLDILPTFCELSALPVPEGRSLDGTSIVRLFNGNHVDRERPLFWHYYGGADNMQVALRDGDWKIVARWDGPADMPLGGSLQPGVVELLKASQLSHFELYHLSDDVSESQELSASYPDLFARLSARTQQMYLEVIAEGPEWEFPATE